MCLTARVSPRGPGGKCKQVRSTITRFTNILQFVAEVVVGSTASDFKLHIWLIALRTKRVSTVSVFSEVRSMGSLVFHQFHSHGVVGMLCLESEMPRDEENHFSRIAKC